MNKEHLRINLARDLAEGGEYIKAMKLSEEPLCDNPNHVGWLTLNVYCLEKMGKIPLAYQLCKRLLEMSPRDAAVWLNMVNLESRLWMVESAVKSAKRGLQFALKPEDKLKLYINVGCIYVDSGRFEEGMKWLQKGAAIDPNADKVISNMGFCQLALGDWQNGWESYRKSLGQQWRPRTQYKDEPEWDGTPGKRVVLYGEQGIGDQICFASMIEDAEKDISIIIDTYPKLKNLFARSFPNVSVYGTFGDELHAWKREDREFDCSLPIGQIGQYYRTSAEAFPKKPYLTPDSERVMMWRSLFATKGKPVIGIGWTGGIQRTGRKFRISTLEDWLPLFKAIDAHWVSLEYKPSKEVDEFKAAHPEIDIKEYPFATLTDDYDDTAALVAALDLVVSVPTSVGHLAGALGIPNIWLKHSMPCWKVKSGMLFHPVTHFVNWRGTWKATVQDAIEPARSTLGTTADSRWLSTSCATRSSPTLASLSA